MDLNNIRQISKRLILSFKIKTSSQLFRLAKRIYHRLPIPSSWKRKLRGPVRNFLSTSATKTTGASHSFNENIHRLNTTKHLSLAASFIRMRSEVSLKNFRILIILFCDSGSIKSLSQTLDDLSRQYFREKDLIIIGEKNLIPLLENLRHPFELREEIQVDTFEKYSNDYSHFIVLDSGNRTVENTLLSLLFHLSHNEECLGTYSDYRTEEIPHYLPDWDPVLIQYENYIEAPILFKYSAAISGIKDIVPSTQKPLLTFEDWERLVHQFLKTLPPHSLHHLPEELFTLKTTMNAHEAFRAPHEKKFSVSVIIPTNGKKLSILKNCLDSITMKTTYHSPLEIILLDNSRGQSHTSYYTYLKELDNKNIKVITYDHPFNWSAINNFGSSLASGEILLFLNDDTEVISSEWLSTFLEPFIFPWVGVVAPRLIYPDGTIQHEGATLLPYGGGAANIGIGAKMLPDSLWNRNPRSVTTVMGACLATRSDLFRQFGSFDERYRIVLSETAYCLTVGKSGFQVVYNPHTTLIHHERMSRKGMDPPEDELLFWSDWRDKILAPDPYYPGIYEKTLESVKFEISPRKQSLTTLESPFLYPNEIQNILVLQSDSLNSGIVLGNITNALRKKIPSSNIFVACDPWAKNLLEKQGIAEETFGINHFIETESYNLNWPVFDIAIDLGVSTKNRSAIEKSGAILTMGLTYQKSGNELLDSGMTQGLTLPISRFGRSHYMEQYICLLESIPLITPCTQKTHRRTNTSLTIGINTGSCPDEQKWPITHFEELTTILLKLGIGVILLGDERDCSSNSNILKKLEDKFKGNIHDFTGKYGLTDYQRVVEEKCDVYIGNNADLTRLVASDGIPTIAIFGGIVDPFEYFPVGRNVSVIFCDVPCAPCYSKTCSFGRECFNEVFPEDILKLIRKYIQ